MYNPSYSQGTPLELVRELVEFGTLVTTDTGGSIELGCFPFLLEGELQVGGKLLSHMARANPQWKSLVSGRQAVVQFLGPHAYVTPSWYEPLADNVPTWNYALLEVRGTPRLIEDKSAAREMMKHLVKRYESEKTQPWELSLSEEDWTGFLGAIVCFEVRIERVESKFKLSQTRSAVEREEVARRFGESQDGRERALGMLMRRLQGFT